MQYLSEEIASLVKRKQASSLVKKQYACGIFQDYNLQPKGREKEIPNR